MVTLFYSEFIFCFLSVTKGGLTIKVSSHIMYFLNSDCGHKRSLIFTSWLMEEKGGKLIQEKYSFVNTVIAYSRLRM